MDGSPQPADVTQERGRRDAQWPLPLLYAISEALNASAGLALSTTLQRMLSITARSLGAVDGYLVVLDKAGRVTHRLSLVGWGAAEGQEGAKERTLEEGLVSQVMRSRQPIVVSDFRHDPRHADLSLPGDRHGSTIAVPLMLSDHLVGVLVLVSDRPGHFGQQDLALLTTVAGQAAIAIENARLRARERHRHRLAEALHQSARIINATSDLSQALNAVLDQMTSVLPCGGCAVFLMEQGRLRMAASRGLKPSPEAQSLNLDSQEAGWAWQVIREGRPRIFTDGGTTPGGLPLPGWDDLPSYIGAPLTARQETLGLLLVASRPPHLYSEDEAQMVAAFADSIAMAVANARLLQETDRRLQELAFLNETGQAITSTLDLDRILGVLMDRVRDLLGVDACSIALREEESGDLIFAAASGEGAETVLGLRLSRGQGIAGWVAETGQPLIVDDTTRDPRFYQGVDRQSGFTTRTILCVPMVLKGQTVGVIEAMNPRGGTFTQDQAELLSALAGLAASAVENARLFARIRAAETRYESLFEENADPIFITDADGQVVDANRRALQLMGWSKERFQAFPIASLGEPFAKALEQALQGEAVVFQAQLPPGVEGVTCEVRVKQVRVDGQVLFQWIGRDISAEIELQKMQEDMARMIVHDLRNPLGNIMNSLELLREVLAEEEPSVPPEELLSIAQRSGRRLHQLIGSILDISRLETGQAILERRSIALDKLVAEAVEFVRPQANIKLQSLELEIPSDLPPVYVDPDMITRVLVNLLDNAVKFTAVGGAIRLSLMAKEGMVMVSVSDTGPGIPLDFQSRIFEKF
ncbi:MAG TPA: GAF domain-containing protein, partial [Chloroflexi bacterium]|nr:GAF domain-containing protein [Chloroflexota bacterium]